MAASASSSDFRGVGACSNTVEVACLVVGVDILIEYSTTGMSSSLTSGFPNIMLFGGSYTPKRVPGKMVAGADEVGRG